MAASATAGVFLANTRSLCFRKAESSKRLLQPFKPEAVSDIGFVASQLGGIKISYDMSSQLPKSISISSPPALQPIVARNFSNLQFPIFSLFLFFFNEHFFFRNFGSHFSCS